jgi:hypothetical protein
MASAGFAACMGGANDLVYVTVKPSLFSLASPETILQVSDAD